MLSNPPRAGRGSYEALVNPSRSIFLFFFKKKYQREPKLQQCKELLGFDVLLALHPNNQYVTHAVPMALHNRIARQWSVA